uniref:Uncharacterized protein n=1 Tax=Tetranychus urticae TaxID=32264 RepID=T1L3H1_TETUR
MFYARTENEPQLDSFKEQIHKNFRKPEPEKIDLKFKQKPFETRWSPKVLRIAKLLEAFFIDRESLFKLTPSPLQLV